MPPHVGGYRKSHALPTAGVSRTRPIWLVPQGTHRVTHIDEVLPHLFDKSIAYAKERAKTKKPSSYLPCRFRIRLLFPFTRAPVK